MEDIERSNLARTIKRYRKARKLTMEQLSEKSGINLRDRIYIRRAERR